MSWKNSNSSTTTAPLCLACSSSLPPRLWKRTTAVQQQGAQSGQTSSELLFLTLCCGCPLCPSCLTSNPRLARYDPCLACLGGVGAVGTKKPQGQYPAASNVDGAVRDEDVFVVGDEDEDEASETDDGEAAKASGVASPSFEEGAGPPEPDVQVRPYAEPDKPTEHTEPSIDSNQGSPGRYYIRPDDTLVGISLRLGVEVSTTATSLPFPSGIPQPRKQGRTLCRLNDLPPSTIRTTPHLLHTRTFLILPQSHPQQQHAVNDISPEEEAQRTRVHAQVSLQHVTKETDGGIAQAYVALAEDGDSEPDVASLKAEGEKEPRRVAPTRITLEERALDRYLDDDEWERRERAEGRGVHIQRFPIGGPQVRKSGEKAGQWARWGS
jgi:hypothetical protein